MKAVRSDRLKEIIDSPDNRDKFRKFIITRSAATGQFVNTKGAGTSVTFVVEKSSTTRKS